MTQGGKIQRSLIMSHVLQRKLGTHGKSKPHSVSGLFPHWHTYLCYTASLQTCHTAAMKLTA